MDFEKMLELLCGSILFVCLVLTLPYSYEWHELAGFLHAFVLVLTAFWTLGVLVAPAIEEIECDDD